MRVSAIVFGAWEEPSGRSWTNVLAIAGTGAGGMGVGLEVMSGRDHEAFAVQDLAWLLVERERTDRYVAGFIIPAAEPECEGR